jgi:hypothetical protein
MKCRCATLTELRDNEAESYADEHLRKVRVYPDGWHIEYVCPDTGKRWLMDFIQSGLQGGGFPRLRRLPLPPDQPK